MEQVQNAVLELKEERMAYKYFDLLLGLFVAVLLISNIASTKILELGPFTFDGGTILFPISYIFGDVMTEVYGFRSSRRAIWSGFFALVLMAGVFTLVGMMRPAPGWENQEAYRAILMSTPRIIVASIVAYFCGEFVNSVILSRLKIRMQGRYLWMRTIGSTLVGELIDTAVFAVIAFSFVLPNELLVSVIISNYIFKTLYEILATPVTYLVVNKLKQAEQIDTYDYGIKYNPFKIV